MLCPLIYLYFFNLGLDNKTMINLFYKTTARSQNVYLETVDHPQLAYCNTFYLDLI